MWFTLSLTSEKRIEHDRQHADMTVLYSESLIPVYFVTLEGGHNYILRRDVHVEVNFILLYLSISIR